MTFARSYALQLLDDTGTLSIPVNLDAIAEAKNIVIKEDAVKGYTGMLLVADDAAIISVKQSIKETSRKRFTIAHEMGHFTIPGHITRENNIYKCSDKDISSFGKHSNKEVEANYFAAELLMPDNHFINRIELKDLNRKLIQELSDEFLTSLTATSIRFVTFKTEYSLILSEKSKIRWFHRGDEFHFYINAIPGTNIHEDSYAYDFFNGDELPENLNTVPSYAWIDDHKIRDHHNVKEMSISLPSYNQVLSFLYIENYEEDEYDDSDYIELNGYPHFK